MVMVMMMMMRRVVKRWVGVGGPSVLGRRDMSSGSSRKRAVNVRKINPKAPFPEAAAISQSLYHLIKQHGPLSVSNTWLLAKDANICGLNSKTHMKTMLKWMRGRKMLKLFCNHVGSTKKFLHSTLPDVPQATHSESLPLTLQTQKPSLKNNNKKNTKNQHN